LYDNIEENLESIMHANHSAQQRPIAQGIASLGRGKDTMLVHMTPKEVAGLQQIAMAHGGSLTINPQTGLPEAGFLSAILPMIAGALLAPMTGGLSAALLVGGATGLATGSVKKGLMAGMGAFGGAGIGEGLAAAGASTVPAATTSAIPAATTTAATTALPTAATTAGANASGLGLNAAGASNALNPSILNAGSNVGTVGGLNLPASLTNPVSGMAANPSLAAPTAGAGAEAVANAAKVAPDFSVTQPSQLGMSPNQVVSQTNIIGKPLVPPPVPATPPPSAASNMGQGIKNLATGQEGAWSKFYGQAGSPAGTVNGAAVPEVAKTGIGGLSGAVKYGGAAAMPILAETNKPKPLPGQPPEEYYNTSYSSGERNPRFGLPGEPYFIKQGYGSGSTSKTANIAGGGLLAFSGKSGSYVPESATAARTLKGMYSGEDDSDKPVIPTLDNKTPDFEGYATAPSLDKALDKLSDKQIAALAKKSKNPILRGAAASKDLASRGSGSGIYESDPEDYYKAASGGSIGYEGGGDVKPEDQQPRQSPFAMRQGQGSTQPAYQSPFAIQQNRPDPTENARYMAGLNASLRGAPPAQYSAPKMTYTGDTTTTNPDYNPDSKQDPKYTNPNYTYTPPSSTYPTSGGSPVTDEWGNTYAGPTTAPTTAPTADVMPRSTAPTDGPATDYKTPTYTYDPGSRTYTDITPPAPPPEPEVPTYNGSPIQTDENGRPFVMVEGDDGGVRRDYRMGRDDGPSSQEKAGGPIKAKKYAMGGIATLPTYAAGGKLLNGDGDGMSDSIPAVINGPKPQRAALADGEFVIPADVVSHLGNGSTKAGAKRLYQMMDKVRMARVGNKKQGKQINPSKFMPA
jgi:hypothetical protein